MDLFCGNDLLVASAQACRFGAVGLDALAQDFWVLAKFRLRFGDVWNFNYRGGSQSSRPRRCSRIREDAYVFSRRVIRREVSRHLKGGVVERGLLDVVAAGYLRDDRPLDVVPRRADLLANA
jgi:hypothetical protein